MSLLGLVRHLAEVEQFWTRRVMLNESVPKPYSSNDRDGDFDGAVGEPDVVADAFATWEREIAATDGMIAGIDDLGTVSANPDRPIALRELLVHLIEEYARHCGHADLLRECIDGRVGQ
jgi:hypothetical protein